MEQKMAYLFDLDTREYLFDWIYVEVDENEEYELQKNATFQKPIRDDGLAFVLPVFIDGKWQEGGTPPEPTIPEPTETDLLGQALSEEKIQRILTEATVTDLEKQVSDLGTQLVQEKLEAMEKDQQIASQAQAIQELGEQVVAMRTQQLLSEGSK